MAAVSLARASLELVPASFSYELVCHVAACVWVSMFAIWNLVFVQLFVYLFIRALGGNRHLSALLCFSLVRPWEVVLTSFFGLYEVSGKQKGKQRVPSTLRCRKFPGKTEGVWCSILETREFP